MLKECSEAWKNPEHDEPVNSCPDTYGHFGRASAPSVLALARVADQRCFKGKVWSKQAVFRGGLSCLWFSPAAALDCQPDVPIGWAQCKHLAKLYDIIPHWNNFSPQAHPFQAPPQKAPSISDIGADNPKRVHPCPFLWDISSEIKTRFWDIFLTSKGNITWFS